MREKRLGTQQRKRRRPGFQVERARDCENQICMAVEFFYKLASAKEKKEQNNYNKIQMVENEGRDLEEPFDEDFWLKVGFKSKLGEKKDRFFPSTYHIFPSLIVYGSRPSSTATINLYVQNFTRQNILLSKSIMFNHCKLPSSIFPL